VVSYQVVMTSARSGWPLQVSVGIVIYFRWRFTVAGDGSPCCWPWWKTRGLGPRLASLCPHGYGVGDDSCYQFHLKWFFLAVAALPGVWFLAARVVDSGSNMVAIADWRVGLFCSQTEGEHPQTGQSGTGQSFDSLGVFLPELGWSIPPVP